MPLARNYGGPVAFCSHACQAEYYWRASERLRGRGRLVPQTASYYARRIAPPVVYCRTCRNPRTAGRLRLFHRDGDWRNNAPDNLYWQCMSCWRKAHPVPR